MRRSLAPVSRDRRLDTGHMWERTAKTLHFKWNFWARSTIDGQDEHFCSISHGVTLG
jgi:hypothetical protein